MFDSPIGALGHNWNDTFKPSPFYSSCLNFDNKTESYEPAEKAVEKAKAQAKAKTKQKAEANTASACIGRATLLVYALLVTASMYCML